MTATLLASDQHARETHATVVGGQPLSDDQHARETQNGCVVADTPAVDQSSRETQKNSVDGIISSQPPTNFSALPTMAASRGWLELRVWVEMFHDAQLQRIATTNRAERGGVDPGLYQPYLEVIERAENTARLGMIRCYRRVVPAPIREWQKDEKGVGDKTLARLLGHLGHPVHATPHHWEGTGTKRVLIADEPYDRTVTQLWQYCGHGDPARRVHKGMTAPELAGLGKPDLKMLVHLLAEKCMMQKPKPGEPAPLYREVYDTRRLVTAERLHTTPCVRCGPSGKPAAEGTPWNDGHKHADALRIVGKELLRDLWQIAS